MNIELNKQQLHEVIQTLICCQNEPVQTLFEHFDFNVPNAQQIDELLKPLFRAYKADNIKIDQSSN